MRFKLDGGLRLFSSAWKKSQQQPANSSPVSSFICNTGRSNELDVPAVANSGNEILTFLKNELAKIKIGKATPAMIDALKVDLKDYSTTIRNIGTVTVLEAQKLVVTPYSPDNGKDIVKAVNSSNMNFTATVESPTRIVVTVPKVTREIREATSKHVASLSEGYKKRLRELRQDVLAAAKKEIKDEDVRRRGEKDLQKLIDDLGAKIVTMVEGKQKELENQ